MAISEQNQNADHGLLSKAFLPLTLVNILVVLSHAVNGYVTAVIAPSIVLDLGGAQYMFWLFALFQVGSICAGIVAGNFKLRFGTRPIFIIASLLLAAGSTIGGLANSLTIVIIARGLQGLSEGMLISLLYVALADHLPQRLLPRMMALSSTLWSVAAAATPALAGTLTQFVSWRAAFLFNLPLVGLLLVLAVSFLPKTERPSENPPFPLKRLVLLLAALLIVGFAGQIQNLVLLGIIIMLASLLLIAFATFDQKAAERFMPPNLFSIRTNMGRAFLAIGLFALGSSATNIYMVAILQSVWDLTPLTAGYTVALIAFSWTIFAWMSNNIKGEDRRLLSIKLGSAAIFTGYLIAAFGISLGQYLVVTIGLVAIGAGFGSSSPLLRQVIMTQSPTEHKSIASGAMAPIQFTGAVVGAAMAGFIALTLGLFEGTSGDKVFSPDVAMSAGSGLLFVFTIFPALAFLAATQIKNTEPSAQPTKNKA